MNRAGAVELLMPVVQPAELWQETGRFQKMGPELLRVKDRHDRDFIVQPTSEEVITDIARQELRSYRQLPKNFYHIQTKFRDERRPRFGVMRGREFTMKDAYSFDRDVEAAARATTTCTRPTARIFDRSWAAVPRGRGRHRLDRRRRSHEFQVIADTGEDAIVYCPTSTTPPTSRWPKRVALLRRTRCAPGARQDAHAGQEHLRRRGVAAWPAAAETVKSLVLATDELDNAQATSPRPQVWLLLVRGDHDLNEIKAGKVDGLKGGFRFATAAEIDAHFGCKPGYLGPIGLKQPVKIVADRTVAA
jgi:prolyl-tRNA synthetase